MYLRQISPRRGVPQTNTLEVGLPQTKGPGCASDKWARPRWVYLGQMRLRWCALDKRGRRHLNRRRPPARGGVYLRQKGPPEVGVGLGQKGPPKKLASFQWGWGPRTKRPHPGVPPSRPHQASRCQCGSWLSITASSLERLAGVPAAGGENWLTPTASTVPTKSILSAVCAVVQAPCYYAHVHTPPAHGAALSWPRLR